MLLDLDRLDDISRGLRLFSHNAPNVFSIRDRDFGDGGATSLRAQADATLRDSGLPEATRVQLFTMPRVFGYGFNPLSLYFCSDDAGDLFAIIYEVHNTFGERHRYALPWREGRTEETAKAFYVSPFLHNNMRYRFDASEPGERITLKIEGGDSEGPLIVARLHGERRKLTDTSLLRLLVSIPLLTLKVIAAIHWQAAKMWLKGFRTPATS
ncbi:hypothetical protein FHS46_001762 [Variibacter gotjawalensis]|nr:hypothetical protein [Variibacter gotjawalensis]